MSDRNGALPEGWAEATLGDVTVKKVEQVKRDGPLTYIDIGAVDNGTKRIEEPNLLGKDDKIPSRARQVVAANDVLVSMTRPNLNAVAKVPAELDGEIGSTGFDVLRAIEVEPEWVFNTVKSRDFVDSMSAIVQGALYPAVRPGDVREYKLQLPPLAEQRRIVSKIESLQERSSRARRALSEVGPLLEQFRQSVLRAAFSGRLTADWRAATRYVEPAPELLSRIRTERRHRWEQSELAKYEAKGKKPPQNWQVKYKEAQLLNESGLEELPESWCWCRVDDVGDVQLGRQRAPKYHSGPNMRPYLRVMNVYEDRIDIGDVMEMDFSGADYERYKLSYGDILLNEGQSFELVGRPAIYRDEIPGACFTNTLVRFRADLPLTYDYPQLVFLAYLKTARFQRIASRTVNIAHLGAGRFAEMEFPLPPLDEQVEVVRRARISLDMINSLEAKLAESESALTQLDQSILAKAFRGELVPQDPRDEPASELLARIRTTRASAATKKKSKSQKSRMKGAAK